MIPRPAINANSNTDMANNHERAAELELARKKELELLAVETLRQVIDSSDEKLVPEKLDAFQKKQFTNQVYDTLVEVQDSKQRQLSQSDKQKIIQQVLDEIFGFGPINELIGDPTVTEIMINGFDNVYIERGGKLLKSEITFRDNTHLSHTINKIINPLGRRVDESCPTVDARLPDGSRVNAIIPPLSLRGPCVTIRKFSKDPFGVDDLVNFGSLSRDMAGFLAACVRARINMIVSGGTGSGKTTTLNVLSGFIPGSERIVTVEDTAELQLHQDNLVPLESRPANMEGRGQFTIRELVVNCLRMRPDRIVVGEVRGGEALDMLQAMNTGHDGSISTLHANSPKDAMTRLETMVLMAGMELPLRAIREQIASAVNLVVQQSRLHDGSRKITRISEVLGLNGDSIMIQDIFVFKQEGIDENGKILGRHLPTGVIPLCMEKLKDYGEQFDITAVPGFAGDTAAPDITGAMEETPETMPQDTPEEAVAAETVPVIDAVLDEPSPGNTAEEFPAAETAAEAEAENHAPAIPAINDETIGGPAAGQPEPEVDGTVPSSAGLPEEEDENEEAVATEEATEEATIAAAAEEAAIAAAEEEAEAAAEEEAEAEAEAEDATDEETEPSPASLSAEFTALPQEPADGNSPSPLCLKNGVPAQAEIGEVLYFEICLSNTGDQILYNIYIGDELLAWHARIEVLAPGESRTFDADCYAAGDRRERLHGTTAARAETVEGEKVSTSYSYEIEVFAPQLSIAVSAPATADAVPGGELNLGLTVTNGSPRVDLFDLQVSDSSLQWSGIPETLPAGESCFLQAKYPVPAGAEGTIVEDLASSVNVSAATRFGEPATARTDWRIPLQSVRMENELQLPLPTLALVTAGAGGAEYGYAHAAELPADTGAAAQQPRPWDYLPPAASAHPSDASTAMQTAASAGENAQDWDEAAGCANAAQNSTPPIPSAPPPPPAPALPPRPAAAATAAAPPGEASTAVRIPPGMRGFTLPVCAAGGLFKFMQPGDRVDVLIFSPATGAPGQKPACSTVENAVFLAADAPPGDSAGSAVTVLLAVPPAQLPELVCALPEGTFHLVLRPSGDDAASAS